jgi:hypothetical protein
VFRKDSIITSFHSIVTGKNCQQKYAFVPCMYCVKHGYRNCKLPLTVHGVNEIRDNDFSNTLRNFILLYSKFLLVLTTFLRRLFAEGQKLD